MMDVGRGGGAEKVCREKGKVRASLLICELGFITHLL